MLYAFVFALGLLGLAAYLLVIFREVPGAVEERLGNLDALPDDIGQWRIDDSSAAGQAATARGEQREVRVWHQPSGGLFGGERLCEQVRYRHIDSGEIARSEPDRPLKRRRHKSPETPS